MVVADGLVLTWQAIWVSLFFFFIYFHHSRLTAHPVRSAQTWVEKSQSVTIDLAKDRVDSGLVLALYGWAINILRSYKKCIKQFVLGNI